MVLLELKKSDVEIFEMSIYLFVFVVRFLDIAIF